ncbi:alpha-(1,3)-fucosyltransferase C-like [Danaus plexippus]|uniref:alpha-(1,3)-fucosyltransferase C-like n=1 Tax=Danaus plexippus TaxID=13037 RepID=UPI002AAF974B|nr:alpha-(1,3)-fucosyltransferase C-like [Danaus plexippus]
MVRILKLLKSHIILFAIVCLLAIRKSFKEVKITKIDRFVPDMKYILVWTNIYGIEEEGQKYFISKNCKHINCYITKNDSLFNDVRYFDAILFDGQDVSRDIIALPQLRSTMQKYVFVAKESSDNFPVCNKIYDNFFNWTWTYRYDSTISYHFITVFNYQYIELGNRFLWETYMKPIDKTLKSQFITKSKAAVIFLDKCKSRSKREDVIDKLKGYLSKYNLTIDIFGPCSDKKCKRKNMKPCLWRLKKTYYFYLAFEDSISLDYITDIVLYAYNNNAIPIVYGGAQYDK